MYESIIFSVVVTLTGLLVTFVVSLHQGFVISKINQFWKIIMIGYIGFVSCRACLQDACCAQIGDVKFFVSNMLVFRHFMLRLWAGYMMMHSAWNMKLPTQDKIAQKFSARFTKTEFTKQTSLLHCNCTFKLKYTINVNLASVNFMLSIELLQ